MTMKRVLQLASLILAPFLMFGQSVPSEAKRAITVSDTIATVRAADPAYFYGVSSEGRVAKFSPDGKKFLVVVRKGNLNNNTNEFSVLLFKTDEALSSPKPDLLLTMSSSSNRNAILHLKWLAESQTIAFLGENQGEVPQVYTFDLRTRQLQKLTTHATALTSYDITPDGGTVIFIAGLPVTKFIGSEAAQRGGIVITNQSLSQLLA